MSLDAYSEAVALYRTLVAVDQRYQYDLAVSLHNVASSLKMLDRVPEALPVQAEAVKALRDLTDTPDGSLDPMRFAALRLYGDL